MLHTINSVMKHKTAFINLAKELSNASKACKIIGVSHDTFYRYFELADEGGVDSLINYNFKNHTDDAAEHAIVNYAINFPAHS